MSRLGLLIGFARMRVLEGLGTVYISGSYVARDRVCAVCY